jgi:hypothetical protein|tara:strand:+ start:5 stop:355 length:351 start_codon:yes stop_codon:yes gene_type:complete
MNYFLITDNCRDGEHEYYDYIAVETKMTYEELEDNKDFWEECFLAWQFGYTEQVGDDWWSDNRIVSIYTQVPLTKNQYDVLSDVTGAWTLEQIIKNGEGNWTPSDENSKHYELEVA